MTRECDASFESARATRNRLAEGRGSTEEVVEATLERIAARRHLGSFLHVDAEGARRRASELNAKLARGERPGAFFGLPIAVKNNILVRGWRTTCGSRILEHDVAEMDADVVRRIREEDGILVGATNLDEFAMGSSNEHSAFHPTLNPWDEERVPGGSSGGSAAAVASDAVPLALGSDTGGSIRQPAAFCGVSGFKPTYGRVSRRGLVAFASSLDQIGPLARRCEDLEWLFRVLDGHDPLDSTSSRVARDEPPLPELAGLRIGLPSAFFPHDLDPSVRRAIEAALLDLERAGAELVPLEIERLNDAMALYYVIAMAEASSNLARYDGARYGSREAAERLEEMYSRTRARGFGTEVKRRILLGTFVLSSGHREAWYDHAQKVRRLLRDELAAAFGKVDVLCGPTTPTAAFRLGEKTRDPLDMYRCDVFATPANLAGLPALSVPCGFDEDGLPIGLQWIGPANADLFVLGLGRRFQERNDAHLARRTFEEGTR